LNYPTRYPQGQQLSALLIACALAALAGCSVVPDYQKPEAPRSAAYAPASAPIATQTVASEAPTGAAQRLDPAKDIPYDWWKLFQSPQLNSLIERAFKANPSIESAQAALRQADEYVTAQRGYFYPTVGVSYSATRNKLAGNMGGNSPGVQQNGQVIQAGSTTGAPPVSPAYYNFHTAQLTVGYVPDVFGANRWAVESLEAQRDAQRYQLEAAYLTLASNVVAAALQEASLRAQIAAAEKLVDANRENLDIMQKQLKLGYVSALDVAAQQAALAQAEQGLIPLKKQLELTRDLLRALVGNLQDQDIPETFELSSLHLPEELPLSLPSRLVDQRPDVRAAEAQLHSASAQYGVAVANRYPQFSISADIGGMATTPGWMFKSGGQFFNIGADVAYTIFDGGTLKAKSRAAQQAMVQAAAQYRSTVITAVQNVADTLHTIQFDAEALKAAAATAQAMELTRDLTRKQYQLGDASYQMVLLAEQNHQQAQIALIQAQTNRLGDTAALYQALGGGWWNRPDSNAENADKKDTGGQTDAAQGETGRPAADAAQQPAPAQPPAASPQPVPASQAQKTEDTKQ
jgi:NodT family efflux transporter outer membrane factor (OMF) lipoprotein